MAVAKSHSHSVPSTSFKGTAEMLNAAAVVMRDPLGVSPELYMSRDAQIVAFCEFLLRGSDGEFDARELAYLKRVRRARGRISKS